MRGCKHGDARPESGLGKGTLATTRSGLATLIADGLHDFEFDIQTLFAWMRLFPRTWCMLSIEPVFRAAGVNKYSNIPMARISLGRRCSFLTFFSKPVLYPHF